MRNEARDIYCDCMEMAYTSIMHPIEWCANFSKHELSDCLDFKQDFVV